MEENKMTLTLEEKSAVQKYQKDIRDILTALGSVRKQLIKSENDLLLKIDNLENEYVNYLKMLAVGRGMPEDEDWIFDPGNYVFTKKH